MSLHGPTYVYAGSGTWPLSVDLTCKMLEEAVDPRSIKRVEQFSSIDKNTRAVVIPDGNALSMLNGDLGRNDTYHKIKQYVENGGAFLGISGGAILASEIWITKYRIFDTPGNVSVSPLQRAGQVYNRVIRSGALSEGSWSMSLYPGRFSAPHTLCEDDPKNLGNLCSLDVAFSTDDPPFRAVYYSGVAFLNVPQGTKPLLYYKDPLDMRRAEFVPQGNGTLPPLYRLTDERIQETKPVAALSYTHGLGKVVLTGIHPEIDPNTFSKEARRYQVNSHYKQLVASELKRRELINNIFAELAFTKPAAEPLLALSQMQQMSLEQPQPILPTIAFGQAMWASFFGDVGVEPPLPAYIEALLNEPCPFWPAKKVRETHFLTLIPKTVNGKPLTLALLGELVKSPKKGIPTQYSYISAGKYQDVEASASHWVLMTRDVLPGTRNENYEDQIAVLEMYRRTKEPSYEAPSLLEAAVTIFMDYFMSGNYSGFGKDRPTYTRSSDKSDRGWDTGVGDMDSSGLFVNTGDTENSESSGLAAIRRF